MIIWLLIYEQMIMCNSQIIYNFGWSGFWGFCTMLQWAVLSMCQGSITAT